MSSLLQRHSQPCGQRVQPVHRMLAVLKVPTAPRPASTGGGPAAVSVAERQARPGQGNVHVKVFISSVTNLLKEEREALPPFLRVIDRDALRFEDFLSQDRSSRQACIAGVESAEVYVLLLGPRYGEPFPDTGLSPTAEEYRAARNLGRPILVFAKSTDEPDEPRQAEFKEEVGHYVNGRFWKSFTNPMSLTIAVGQALMELPVPNQPFRLRPLASPVQVWGATVAGWLKTDYSMAPDLAYNTFPFPERTATGEQRVVQAVLDARAAHPGSSLADLYDPLGMPQDVLPAHRALDRSWTSRSPDDAGSRATATASPRCSLATRSWWALGSWRPHQRGPRTVAGAETESLVDLRAPACWTS